MKTFEDVRYLQEGLYDPNIFKAFFLQVVQVLVKHL